MPRIVYSNLSEDDLDEIWAYIDSNNPAAAENFMRRLGQTFAMLAKHEGLGTSRPYIDDSVLVFPVDKYLIMFRRIEDGIEIVRVMHSARDLRHIRLQ